MFFWQGDGLKLLCTLCAATAGAVAMYVHPRLDSESNVANLVQLLECRHQ